jgi:iron complex outermembrane receptor protein
MLATALARAEQPAGGVDFFQSELGDILDTPMLAASYTEERPSDAAASAYVVTAETIEKRGYATLVDLLEDMPQFQLQRNSDARRLNLLSVRGIPNNERLVILYDGVRVTPPTGDLLALGGQFSLKNAERVEVVLGPMSAVYGADAFSGVVNVVTRRSYTRTAGARYGRFSSAEANVSAALPLSGGAGADTQAPALSVSFDAAASQTPKLPDFYKNDYAWYNTQYQAGQAKLADGKITAVPVLPYDAHSASSFLNARLTLGDFETGVFRMGESHSSSIGVKPELTLYEKDARFDSRYWTAYARHVYMSPDGAWKLSTQASVYSYQITPETEFVNSFSGYNEAYKYAEAQTAAMEETLSLEPVPEFPALLGFTYQDNSVLPYTADLDHRFNPDMSPSSQGFYYSGSTIPVDFYSMHYNNTGAFFRVQTKEVANAVFSLGMRYDYNTSYGATWNPRAGIVWKPGGGEDTVVKLLYGEAYLAPSPFYTNKTLGAFIATNTAAGYYSEFFHVTNPKLKPEEVRSLETTVTQNLGHALRLSLNPYYNKVSNLIQDVGTGAGTFHGVPVGEIEMAENRGTMETYGGTFRADGVLRAGSWNFEPWAAYTYSEGRLRGKTIPFNARHVIQAGTSVLRGRFNVTPKLLYRSATLDQDGTRVGGFVVVDLYARYACKYVPGLTAYLDIKNLFDRRYYNAAYGGGEDHLIGAPQDPFSLSAGVNYKF